MARLISNSYSFFPCQIFFWETTPIGHFFLLSSISNFEVDCDEERGGGGGESPKVGRGGGIVFPTLLLLPPGASVILVDAHSPPPREKRGGDFLCIFPVARERAPKRKGGFGGGILLTPLLLLRRRRRRRWFFSLRCVTEFSRLLFSFFCHPPPLPPPFVFLAARCILPLLPLLSSSNSSTFFRFFCQIHKRWRREGKRFLRLVRVENRLLAVDAAAISFPTFPLLLFSFCMLIRPSRRRRHKEGKCKSRTS